MDGGRDSSFPRYSVFLCVCLYGTSSLRMGLLPSPSLQVVLYKDLGGVMSVEQTLD